MNQGYKIGFTRPAMIRETVLTAQVFLESGDWDEARERIRKGNCFQTRTERSGVILFDEIRKRLSLLNREQIELLAEDFPQDVKQLIWIALCKQYPFIGDFTLEEGNEVARMTALSKPHALQLLKEKLGLVEKRPFKQPGKTKKTAKRQHNGVMQGLAHVTESRAWKTTK